jgi:hypothetical protein
MASTLDDVLSVPSGWTVVDKRVVGDLGAVDPTHPIQIENVDFWGLTLFGQTINFGDVVGSMPDTATWLQQQAQAHGSDVYFVALLHTTEFNFLGIEVDRYRLVVVHSQFQFVAALLAAVVLIGLGIVWICSERPSSNPCPDSLTAFPQQTLQQMCNIFGAGCALQALGTLIIGFSVASIGLAFVLFAFETGLAQQLGIKGPRLPAIPAPTGIQPPRVSVGVGAPEIGPQVRLSTGGRGGRRGGGMGGFR